jgi:hypothetical protein
LGNPAPILSGKNGEVLAMYQGRTGVYSDVNAMFFSGTIQFAKNHLAGVFVTTENESEFLHKARYYGKYALKIRLGEECYLTGGLMAGVVSYQFASSAAGTGGSDTKLDGSLGIAFVLRGLSLGANAFQLPESTIRPMIGDYLLKRYYSFLARYKQEISSDFHLLWMGESKWYTDRAIVARFSLATEFQKLYFGIQGDINGNASAYFGLKIPVFEDKDLQFQANYVMQNLYNKNGYRLNLYEISIGANF